MQKPCTKLEVNKSAISYQKGKQTLLANSRVCLSLVQGFYKWKGLIRKRAAAVAPTETEKKLKKKD